MCLFTRQVPFSVGHEDMVECGAAVSAAGQAGKPASHLMKWCSHEDLHLEPPPSHGGVHDSYTLRALKNGAACRCCPDVMSLEDSHVTVTSMPR